jgi:hypothetical protein
MNRRRICRFPFLVLFLLALAAFAAAQDKSSVDENIDVNISEERVTETNFSRSTEAEIDEKNLSVRVGTSARANTITLTLRGIRATGRFRASLEKITRLLERDRQEP